jgi:hypothetical protein
MAQPAPSPDRLRVFGRCVRDHHDDFGFGVETAAVTDVRSFFVALADRAQLCGELPVSRDCLGQSSSRGPLRRGRDAALDLGKFRGPVHRVADPLLDSLDRDLSLGGRSGGAQVPNGGLGTHLLLLGSFICGRKRHWRPHECAEGDHNR